MIARGIRISTTMSSRLFIALLVAATFFARGSAAQSTPRAANTVEVWRGTSLCLVKPSACNDEVVVYRVTRGPGSDSLSLDARKIVNAQEEEMGVLACRLASGGAAFTCAIPRGTWHFAIRGDSLIGELWLPDNTKFRDVRAERSR